MNSNNHITGSFKEVWKVLFKLGYQTKESNSESNSTWFNPYFDAIVSFNGNGKTCLVQEYVSIPSSSPKVTSMEIQLPYQDYGAVFNITINGNSYELTSSDARIFRYQQGKQRPSISDHSVVSYSKGPGQSGIWFTIIFEQEAQELI